MNNSPTQDEESRQEPFVDDGAGRYEGKQREISLPPADHPGTLLPPLAKLAAMPDDEVEALLDDLGLNLAQRLERICDTGLFGTGNGGLPKPGSWYGSTPGPQGFPDRPTKVYDD